jgi:hypothetical protein
VIFGRSYITLYLHLLTLLLQQSFTLLTMVSKTLILSLFAAGVIARPTEQAEQSVEQLPKAPKAGGSGFSFPKGSGGSGGFSFPKSGGGLVRFDYALVGDIS